MKMTVKRAKMPPVQSVTLTLTLPEAQALASIAEHIGGDAHAGAPRQLLESLCEAVKEEVGQGTIVVSDGVYLYDAR